MQGMLEAFGSSWDSKIVFLQVRALDALNRSALI